MKGLLQEQDLNWDIKEEPVVHEVANDAKDNVAYAAIGYAAWALWS